MGLFDMFRRGGANGSDEIAHDELTAALRAKSCALIDVREPHEYSAGHAPGAVNMPLSSFDPARLPKDKPLVLICQAGGRSAKALARARAAGVANVRHYLPGTGGWARAGGELI